MKNKRILLPEQGVKLKHLFFKSLESDDVETIKKVIVSNTSEDALRQGLWENALKDAADHSACSNGGAYAFWALPDGRFAVGGFDNGGSDMAAYGAWNAAKKCGTVEAMITKAHFDAESFTTETEDSEATPEDIALVKLIMATKIDKLRKTPKR